MDICSFCKSSNLSSCHEGRVCQECGWILSNPEFQNDEVKYIEHNGRTKALLLSVDNQLQSSSVYNQTKRIHEVIEECDQSFKLPEYEKNQILKITQELLQYKYKDTKIRLKSLISAVYFMVCLNSKRLVQLDVYLKELDIKSKQFNKYLLDLKNRYFFQFASFDDQVDEITQKFSKNLCDYLKQEDPTFYKNSKQHFNEHHFIKKSYCLLKESSKDLIENPEIQFYRNGKNPFLYITSILVIVCQFCLNISLQLKTFSVISGFNLQSLKNSIENIENRILILANIFSTKQNDTQKLKLFYDKYIETPSLKLKNKVLKQVIKNITLLQLQINDDDYKSESTSTTDQLYLK